VKTPRGFTLIELTMAVVIAGLALYSLLMVAFTVTAKNVRLESLDVALYLANSKLEEVSSRSYNAISAEVLTPVGGVFSNFSSSVEVYYVSPEALDAPLATNLGYKKIVVKIFSSNLASTAEISTLVTRAAND